MKKISIVAVLIVVLLVGALAGCNPSTNDNDADTVTDGTNQTPDGQTPADGEDQTPVDPTDEDNDNDAEEPGDEYATVGEIIEFKENTVTVLTGDIAEDFEVDTENAKEFYIGETVGIKKASESKYQLERYEDTDHAMRFTTEGYPIITVSGTVKEAAEGKLVVTTENGDITLDAGKDVALEAGAEVIVDYTEFQPDSEEKIFLAVYDEASKMSLTIKSIERTEAGYMQITTVDDKDLENIVYTVDGTVLNCSHTDFAEGDTITVYPGEIREISPTEIDAKMILK